MADIEHRLDTLSDALTQTQQALQQSLLEVQRLRAEMDALHAASNSSVSPAPAIAADISSSSSSDKSELQSLREQQEILAAEIKQHEQTKVETDSKYTLHVTGLALFNAFSNAGVVDTVELPSVALPRNPGSSHGSLGANVRQTVLGLAATGPEVFGAHSSALLNLDFAGGSTTNTFGYNALSGVVRLRDAAIGLDWRHTSVQFGNTEPLISPLSPTSYATVAMPALSASGNLWAWAPQARIEQRIPLSATHGLSLEAGLIDPQSSTYTAVQLDSPVEASRRPGVEGRVSYHADRSTDASPHSLVFGVGAYTANQVYSLSARVHSWAVTGDWQIPITHWINVSGEVYRGRSLGGFGGGLYKDILSGTDPITGAAVNVPVEAAGGWSQLKLNLNSHLEANGMWGIDEALSSSFDRVVLPPSSNSIAYNARNSSVVGNLIFRPRSSIIISPEYRRIMTWRYTGTPNLANIYTLSFGYQF